MAVAWRMARVQVGGDEVAVAGAAEGQAGGRAAGGEGQREGAKKDVLC